MSTVTRFAPSPTGRLHLGHAAAALFAHQRARADDGRFLLRLEDIDPARCRPEHAAAILGDLAWLGLSWDGPVRLQSEHLPEYRAVLDALARCGLLYPCFCTRSDIARAANAPHGPEGVVYPGTCRRLSAQDRARRLAGGDPHALRLDIARALAVTGPLSFVESGLRTPCDPRRFGDVVLARRDAPASYHLCVTHDDAAQGVTLITRGEDLRDATAIHRLLQSLMGWPEPAYAHYAMLTDATGRRLAKRDGAATLATLRAGGADPAAVRVQLAAAFLRGAS